MTATQTKLVPGVGDKQKLYAPIFSHPSSPINVSLMFPYPFKQPTNI